ncbi:BQ2448_6181 [Microbotryum intermedium]|uniref:BQ2448_6181 protein n=1 Tax=Microbotryum intermedium TaxID=269621 RepID=A0A238FNK0_9BASI|nr:BQ2448_6181 [Microbotryum intermedium]
MSQSGHYQYPDAYGNVSPVHSQPQQQFYDPYEPQQAYNSVPLSHTDSFLQHTHNTYQTHPSDMSEANHYQRPLSAASGAAVGAVATAGMYWSPHGGARSPGSHLDEAAWEGGYDEDKPFLQRKRTIIGLALLALVGLGVALGVGLGVGLKKSSSTTQSDEARLSSIASASSKSSADAAAASRSAAQTTVIVVTQTSLSVGTVTASVATTPATSDHHSCNPFHHLLQLGRRSEYYTRGDKHNDTSSESSNDHTGGSRNHNTGCNYDSGGGCHNLWACSDNDGSIRAHVRRSSLFGVSLFISV